jgi:hypothetical protein
MSSLRTERAASKRLGGEGLVIDDAVQVSAGRGQVIDQRVPSGPWCFLPGEKSLPAARQIQPCG